MASAASESFRCATIFSSSLACAAAGRARRRASSAALAAADLVALMSSSLVTADLARAMSVSYFGGVSGRDPGRRRVVADTGHREGLGRIEICPRADRVGRVSRTDDPGVERVQGVFGGGHRRLGLALCTRRGRSAAACGDRTCLWSAGGVPRWRGGAWVSSMEDDAYRTGRAPPRCRRRCIEAT